MHRHQPETRRRVQPGFRTALAFVTTLVLLPGPCGHAAEYRELNTDRDAFTPATTTVEEGLRLLESSYTWIDNRGTPPTNSFPELLIRLGARERLEWRFGFNFEQGSGGSVVSAVEGGEGLLGDELESESNLLYGFKVRVTDQRGWLPRSCVIMEGFTPVSGDVWGTEPASTYAFGWELPREWRFDAAIRYVYADSTEGRFDKWLPSAVLRIPLTDRWEVHGEWFGAWTAGLGDDTVRPFVGPGTHYMITPTFEIGCRMGWGLSRDAAAYFVDSGIGWHF
ncbi:MAG: transporter [Planctomycetaceae bacterium]